MPPSPTPPSYVVREGCHSRLFIAPRCLRRFAGENRRRLSRETYQAARSDEETAVFVGYLSSPLPLFFVRQVSSTGVILLRFIGERRQARSEGGAQNMRDRERLGVSYLSQCLPPSRVSRAPRSLGAFLCSPEKSGKITPVLWAIVRSDECKGSKGTVLSNS